MPPSGDSADRPTGHGGSGNGWTSSCGEHPRRGRRPGTRAAARRQQCSSAETTTAPSGSRCSPEARTIVGDRHPAGDRDPVRRRADGGQAVGTEWVPGPRRTYAPPSGAADRVLGRGGRLRCRPGLRSTAAAQRGQRPGSSAGRRRGPAVGGQVRGDVGRAARAVIGGGRWRGRALAERSSGAGHAVTDRSRQPVTAAMTSRLVMEAF